MAVHVHVHSRASPPISQRRTRHEDLGPKEKEGEVSTVAEVSYAGSGHIGGRGQQAGVGGW